MLVIDSPTTEPPPGPTLAIVVMGVSASGKTTIAEQLAQQLQWEFLEGDRLHGAGNLAKLRRGEPLSDADRWPWLDAIAGWMHERLADRRPVVVACSALRGAYRDRLRQAGAGVRFVYLRVARQALEQRLRQRRHFMPPSLLDSQLATLEDPTGEADVRTVCGERPVEAIVAAIRAELRL